MVRPSRLLTGPVGLVVVFALAACSGTDAAPETTSEFYFPPDSAASTLLPVIPETLPPPDSVSIPVDALFGGDLCDALDTTEVSVERTEYLAIDTCQFTLASGDVVRIEAMSGSEFLDRPSDAQTEDLTGWPEAAETSWSAAVFGGWRVMVRVTNGWFGVTAPTLAVARRMSRSAAQWTLGGAPTEVDVDPVDETVPDDPGPDDTAVDTATDTAPGTTVPDTTAPVTATT